MTFLVDTLRGASRFASSAEDRSIKRSCSRCCRSDITVCVVDKESVALQPEKSGWDQEVKLVLIFMSSMRSTDPGLGDATILTLAVRPVV